MKRISKKLFSGLSMIEVMVSIFVFSLMMTAASSTFSSGIFSYRENKRIERDTENAQFTINDIAKQLRTSTIISSGTTRVRFFDYSQNKCIEYKKNSGGNFLEKASAVPPAAVPPQTLRDNCTGVLNLGAYTRVTTGDVVPVFSVIPSASPTPGPAAVGRVTIVFVVKESSTSTRNVRIQTTVSLRDYKESGIVN